MPRTSRLPGFHTLPASERLDIVAQSAELSDTERKILRVGGLDPEQADKLIENVIGIHSLPIGIATNFLINGREILIPMVIEEPSVVAGASFMAKLARDGGGFYTSSTEPEMIGQIQVLDLPDLEKAAEAVVSHREELLGQVAQQNERLIARGGGPQDIQVRSFAESPVGPMLVVHLVMDCRDAMGANLVNSACELLAESIERITGGRVALRILSNLADQRLAAAECTIPAESLSFDGYPGNQIVQRIIEAWAFALIDPYRAATHNKGIMNGIDPVIIATGNDWRAIEAGAHAYAARNGRYTSLSTWGIDDKGNLSGRLELPMAVGIVGGTTKAHPAAQTALKILGVTSGRELAEIVTAVGLAQNLAALRALATEGIQAGHMALHARQVAVSAGATGRDVDRLAEQMLREGQITPSRAEELMND